MGHGWGPLMQIRPMGRGLLLPLCLLLSAAACAPAADGPAMAEQPDSTQEITDSTDSKPDMIAAQDSTRLLDLPRPPDVDVGADLVEPDAPQDTLEEIAPPVDAGGPYPEEWYFPPVDPANDEWETISPGALGWDEAILQDTLKDLGEHESKGVLLLYKGRILAEHYWDGWDLHSAAPVFSVSKSVVAFLIGQAQEQGLLDIDEPVTTYLGVGWSNMLKILEIFESKITIRHLLTMTSGLNLAGGFDVPAGTVWKYNTYAFKKLILLLETLTGGDIDAHTAAALYAPTGMRDTSWQQNKLSCSARDMARFGLLILAGGQWDGQPLLGDPDYFADMLDSSQDLNEAYGYLWWLNGKDSWLLPDDTAGTDSLIPSAPADLVSAQGLGDKKIYVVPSMHLVLVRHGGPAEETTEEALTEFDDTLWQLLMASAPIPEEDGG